MCRVTKFTVGMLAVCLFSSIAIAADPTAEQVETAINEGVDLEFGIYQSVTSTQILKGGQTSRGDFLYLCDAEVVWKISSDELTEAVQSEFANAETPQGFQQFFPASEMTQMVVAAIRKQLGEFEEGDVVHSIRLRVRLELAGDDWIVTQLETMPKQLRGNPLKSLNTTK